MAIGLRRASAAVLFATCLAACNAFGSGEQSRAGASDSGAGPAVATRSGDRQSGFRVRDDFDADLNAEGGWAAPLNRPATVTADRPFRIRFEVEAGDRAELRAFAFQVRRNDGDWQPLPAEDFPYPLKRIERSPGSLDRDPERDWIIVEGTADALRRLGGENHGLRFEAKDAPLRAWAAPDPDWTPSEFSIELRLASGARGEFGLVFEDAAADGYSLVELVPPDRARMVRVDNGQRRVIADSRVDVPTGRWFELKVEHDGAEWMAELEDQALFEDSRATHRAGSPRLGLLLATSGRVDLRALSIEGEASTPRTSIISSPSFEHGAATEDRLAGSGLPFAGGAGLSLATRTPPWTARRQHGEWSLPIVIRRFADQAALNEAGDRFDFRLIGADGQPVPAAVTASVRLSVSAGHLGGTFVETPMRLGPWQNETGDLYFIIEPSETWNRAMMLQSTDGGRSWREVDGADRPVTGDLEGLATAYDGERIHVLHQISERVLYHAFDPSIGVDAWVVRDESVAAPPEPPTQVADLAVRSDGSIVGVYGSGDGLRYAIRSPEGVWSDAHEIGGPAETTLSGPTVVLGRNDAVHLAYTASNGTAWARRIEANGGVSKAVRIADSLGTGESDAGALLPLATLEDGETVVLVYRTRSGHLREVRTSGNDVWSDPVRVTDRSVVQSAVDSDQVGADLISDGDALHVLFIEEGTGVLFHTVGTNHRWSRPEAIVTDADVQWVRGRLIRTTDGRRALGFVYDAGSNGGSGRNRFHSIPLRSK
jgi:hypothetical protein